MRITTDMKLREIIALPEFAEFKEYLYWADEETDRETLQGAMTQFAGRWNPESMCGGFERIRQLVREGKKVFYPLYDKEEAKKHPDLRERVMFHFPVDKRTRFAVICAGGGYGAVCSMVEAFPTARILNELGYHAFVVQYRTGQYAKAPNPQEDLAEAVRYILNHARELNVDSSGYAAAGFSAGGHLTACFGTESLGYQHYGLPKPAVLFLAYPVITMGAAGRICRA